MTIICGRKACPAWTECPAPINPGSAGCLALRTAYFGLARTNPVPLSPYTDDNVLACPCCRSGEYLHNQDGSENVFCGKCGQPLDWEETQ